MKANIQKKWAKAKNKNLAIFTPTPASAINDLFVHINTSDCQRSTPSHAGSETCLFAGLLSRAPSYFPSSVKLTSQFEAIGGVMSVREGIGGVMSVRDVIGGVVSIRGDLAPGTTGESVNLLANTRQLGDVKN